MNEAVKLTLEYFGIGLFVATALGCWFKECDRHLSTDDLELLLVALLVWPIVVLAVLVALCMAAFKSVKPKAAKWWNKLPDRKDMYPVEWLFCWPVKLYELWRKRHGRQKRED